MFNFPLERPKKYSHEKIKPRLQDINLPSISVGHYQHVGREPNTNYFARMQDYKWKIHSQEFDRIVKEKQRLLKDAIATASEKNTKNKIFNRKVQMKVEEKLKEHDRLLEERRAKLSELLSSEERQYYYETVDQAQRGDETKLEDMTRRAEEIKANREAERRALVAQKRMEQYSKRCVDLRVARTKHMLLESKEAQLKQIKENEAKRAAQKELDNMWHHLTMKEYEERTLREEQDLLEKKHKSKGILDVWQTQIQGKKIAEAEIYKMKQEDKIEVDNIREEIKKTELESEIRKKQKQQEFAQDLSEQISQQEKIVARRRSQEAAFNESMLKLTQLELEREKQAQQDMTVQLKRESKLYQKHLKELEEERKEEERLLNEMLNEHKKQIEGKHEAEYCKLWNAKEKLKRDVLKGRAEQVERKRQDAERNLKLQQIENEFLQKAHDANQCLQKEYARAHLEAQRNYRGDLMKQIEYNNILKQREQEELERQLKAGREEEEKFFKMVEEIIEQETKGRTHHPFKSVLEKSRCPC